MKLFRNARPVASAVGASTTPSLTPSLSTSSPKSVLSAPVVVLTLTSLSNGLASMSSHSDSPPSEPDGLCAIPRTSWVALSPMKALLIRPPLPLPSCAT